MARGGNRFNTHLSGSKGAGSTIVGLALLLAALGILAVAGVFVMRIQSAPQPDPVSLCPANGPTGLLVAVLDLTDPISAAQAASLRAQIDQAVAESPVGTMISIGLVSAVTERGGAAFALCKPLAGADANQLYQNPKQIEARYETGFQRPLAEALDAMMSGEAEDTSPIMEGIQAVLSDTPGFLGGSRADTPRRLLVASDLIQNSDVASFYRGEDWSNFVESADFGRLAGNLNGVDVVILKVPRPAANIRDPEAVEDFWVNYFDHQGAASVRKRVLGDL